MKHLGDYDTSTVIYGKFTTFRPSTGAAFTLAGTPALSVYKDNSTTQSTTGVTLTADFDSVTGLNHFAIDTSADGTFYSAGSNFDVVITTGTVDSVSVVGSVVASFTIRKNSALKPTTAGRTLDVTSTGEAGIDLANIGAPAAGAVPYLGIVDSGTAQAATGTTIQLRAADAFATTELVGAVVVITGGSAGVGQSRVITAYDGTTDTATVDTWTTTPTGTITYVVFASPPASATAFPEIAAIKAKTDLLPAVAAGVANGLLINGTNAGAIVLPDGVTISKASGNALTLSSGGGNGAGLIATGNGSGAGIQGSGGSSGHGILAVGGGLSGSGIQATASAGNSPAIKADGQGSGAGIIATGGATGHGISGVGGATSGNGIRATGTAGNSAALNLVGQGSAAGLLSTGGATGHGISAVGGATSGDGFSAAAATSGHGITATGVGTTKHGVNAAGGSTTSNGINATGGGTGSGIVATSGGGATGDGIRAVAASTNGNGLTAAKTGSGADFNATSTPLTLAKTTNLTGLNDIAATAIVSAGAITTASGAVSSVTTVGSVTGAVGSVTGNVGGNVTGSVGTVNALAANVITAAATAADFTTEIQTGLATAAALATVAGYIDTEVAAIKTVTDKVDTTLQVQTGSEYQFTANALALAPSGGSTPAEVADAVWDELLAGHAGVGSAGAALSAAGSAGDPWGTPLPGAYGAGTAGAIVGTNLDAVVSAIKAKTDNLPTDPADESLVIAATDAIYNRIGAPAGASVSADIAAVNAKTTNLPSDPADESLVIAATDAIMTRLGAPAGASVSADIAGVQSDTNDIQTRIPAALVGGRINADMGAISTDATAADNLEAALDGTGGVTLTLSQLAFNPTGSGDCIAMGGSGSGNGIGFTRSGAGEVFDASVAAALQAEAADALTAYDPPTNAEMVARTLVAADYATAANLATVDTVVDAILATTDKLDTTLQVQTGSEYMFTANALALAPSGTSPTLAEIVDGVWDEPIAGHLVSGSTGAALNGAGAAGDPWTTPLPGAYGAGTAGFIVGTNIDAQISAVKAKTDNLPTDPADESLVIAATDAIYNRIGAPAGASVSADIAAVNAKTTNLPTDPADESLIIAATDAIMTRLGAPAGASVSADVAAVKSQTAAIEADTTVIGATGAGLTALASAANLATLTGYVDTEVAAIKAKTDQLAFGAANTVNANITHVIADPVQANGSTTTNWGGTP